MDAFSWGWLLAACAAASLIKLSAFCVPSSWLASPRIQHIANAMAVELLAVLIILNTLTNSRAMVADARIAAFWWRLLRFGFACRFAGSSA